jgi:SAM-dependent methyltransferase
VTATRQHPTDPIAVRAPSRRGAFNAWFFDSFDRYINIVAGHHKRAAFEGIEPGRILEVGAGTGANFDFLPRGSQVLALEPNTAMHERLRRRAAEAAVNLELVVAPGEAIPLDDGSVDTVICSLVLCTVGDPDAVLSEIERVLRPGGTFRFVEHVAAPHRSPRRWLQRTLSRPWAWIFEGCRLCRDTGNAIAGAGFTSVHVERQRLRLSIFVPVNSAIHGIATKEGPPVSER